MEALTGTSSRSESKMSAPFAHRATRACASEAEAEKYGAVSDDDDDELVGCGVGRRPSESRSKKRLLSNTMRGRGLGSSFDDDDDDDDNVVVDAEPQWGSSLTRRRRASSMRLSLRYSPGSRRNRSDS